MRCDAINSDKRAEFRDRLDAAEAECGSRTIGAVRRFVRDRLDRLDQTPTGG